MSNIIAVVWDFDKTLIGSYMQDPIFNKYGVNGTDFWKEVNSLPQKYWNEQEVKVNKDTIYLNHFINYVKDGKFAGLSNKMLTELGAELKFYNGLPALMDITKKMIAEDPKYTEYDIKVEHYIVSTGFTAMIKGSAVAPYVSGIWGCELIEAPNESGEMVISEIGYTIDNTTKTRALFEINKGVGIVDNIDVNTNLPEEMRRVRFENMIYIADGPSDVPAFSTLNKSGGATFAIYPHNDEKAFRQVEQLRKDGRINMYAEADYSEGTTAYMWITGKIREFADRIREQERRKLQSTISEVPRHLID
ncbi:MAG: haloacid dehalogenase-like hydrolase [Alphaproteobacteria bacterium]|nr:haloacid dehalogenase-like hydrolase [Alphaproteobacteria bacterium]